MHVAIIRPVAFSNVSDVRPVCAYAARGAHLTAANATKQANQNLKAADQSRKSPQPRSEHPWACLDSPYARLNSPLPYPETPQLAREISLGPLRKPTVADCEGLQ